MRIATIATAASVAAALLVAPAQPCAADTILLRNGNRLSGQVIDARRDHVIVLVAGGGMIRIPSGEVASVVEDATMRSFATPQIEPAIEPPEATPPAGAGEAAPPPAASEPEAEVEPAAPPRPPPVAGPDEDRLIARLVLDLGRVARPGGAGSRREAAVAQLVERGLAVVPYVVPAIAKGANAYTRGNAARVVAALAATGKDAIAILEHEGAIPKLLDLLSDETRGMSWWTREQAARALGALTGHAAPWPTGDAQRMSDAERAEALAWRARLAGAGS